MTMQTGVVKVEAEISRAQAERDTLAAEIDGVKALVTAPDLLEMHPELQLQLAQASVTRFGKAVSLVQQGSLASKFRWALEFKMSAGQVIAACMKCAVSRRQPCQRDRIVCIDRHRRVSLDKPVRLFRTWMLLQSLSLGIVPCAPMLACVSQEQS